MKRNGIIILLALLLVLCYSFSFADNTQTSGLFTYKIKGNGTAVITEFDWKTNGNNDIYVPRMIDGYTVTEIGASAFSPEGTRGSQVVVVLPDTITVIGEKAFFGTEISAITIPQSVQLIGSGAFAMCRNIESHNVESGNAVYTTIDGVLFDKTKKELVAFPTGREAYLYTIPQGIVSVGEYAFAGCSFTIDQAEHDIFSGSVKTIGNYAFYNASFYPSGSYEGFSSVGVQSIGDYAFYGARFNCPISAYSVKEIGSYAFSNSSFPLEYFKEKWKFPFTQVEKIGPYAFSGTECRINGATYDTVLFPSSLSELGEGAFLSINFSGNLNYVDTFDLSETSVATIPPYAFSDIEMHISLPETTTCIEEYAFYKNKGWGGVSIPTNVTEIGSYAFAESSGGYLSDGEKSHLKKVGDYAFYNARRIVKPDDETLILPHSLESIGSNAYWTSNTLIIDVPESVTSIGEDFCDRSKTTLKVTPGSYASIYASENGYRIQGEEDTSWLND